MKKNRKHNGKNRGITLIIILLFINLLCVAGCIYLQYSLKQQVKQNKKLQAEIKVLETKNEQIGLEQEALKNERASVQESKELMQNPGTEENSAPAPLGIEGLKERIQASISDRLNFGENWQVYVCRLSDDAREMIGEGRMTAASLIKLYIMGAVYENYDEMISRNGKDNIDSLLRSMITVSDNNAANTLTEMLGQGDAAAGRAVVNSYCMRNGYEDSSMDRMLLETDTDRENYTSAEDCGIFLERIYNGEVLFGEDMMSLLKQQERVEKIPAGVPAGVEVANKTGELGAVENDAAIVFMEGNPYILCVMSENVAEPSSARQAIINISSDVYNSMQ